MAGVEHSAESRTIRFAEVLAAESRVRRRVLETALRRDAPLDAAVL